MWAWLGPGSTSINNIAIDASGEKAAQVFPIYRDGNVVAVHWQTVTVAVGSTLNVRMEGVSGLYPSGTLWGTDTDGAHVLGSGDDDQYVSTALTSPAAVAVGDLIAVVIVQSTGNAQIAIHPSGASWNNQTSTPHGAVYTTSWATTSFGPPSFLLEYDDGVIIPASGGYVAKPGTNIVLTSSANPDEAGNVFTPEIGFRLAGAQVGCALSSGSATFDVILYDSGNNVLVSESAEATYKDNSTGIALLYFSTPYDVVAGQEYRLIVKPNTTNNMIIFRAVIVPGMSRALMGENYYRTQRTDAGAWSNNTGEVVSIFPLVGGFDDGAQAPVESWSNAA